MRGHNSTKYFRTYNCSFVFAEFIQALQNYNANEKMLNMLSLVLFGMLSVLLNVYTFVCMEAHCYEWSDTQSPTAY